MKFDHIVVSSWETFWQTSSWIIRRSQHFDLEDLYLWFRCIDVVDVDVDVDVVLIMLQQYL